MSPSSHTRGHRFGMEHTHALLEWLEHHKRVILNGSKSLLLEASKVRQYRCLEDMNILVPRTVVVTADNDNKEEFVQAIIDAATTYFPNTPFLTKHNRSGKGLGVKLFEDHSNLRKFLEEEYEPPVDGVTILQEFIKSDNNCVIRCEYVAGKFLYALQINATESFEKKIVQQMYVKCPKN